MFATQFKTWELLQGAALEKARQVTRESDVDYAQKFGIKTIFAIDCGGVVRLRAVGPEGQVYGIKVYGPDDLEQGAMVLAKAATLGVIDPKSGVYLTSSP